MYQVSTYIRLGDDERRLWYHWCCRIVRTQSITDRSLRSCSFDIFILFDTKFNPVTAIQLMSNGNCSVLYAHGLLLRLTVCRLWKWPFASRTFSTFITLVISLYRFVRITKFDLELIDISQYTNVLRKDRPHNGAVITWWPAKCWKHAPWSRYKT